VVNLEIHEFVGQEPEVRSFSAVGLILDALLSGLPCSNLPPRRL
jgi:hypothetical protein